MKKKTRNFFSKGSKSAEFPNSPDSGAGEQEEDVIDMLDDE